MFIGTNAWDSTNHADNNSLIALGTLAGHRDSWDVGLKQSQQAHGPGALRASPQRQEFSRVIGGVFVA
jgi:hypothetical protein